MPALRYGSALLAVILALVFVVRPLMKRARRAAGDGGETAAANETAERVAAIQGAGEQGGNESYDDLPEQVRLARQLAANRPERAVEALQRMLEPPAEGESAQGARTA